MALATSSSGLLLRGMRTPYPCGRRSSQTPTSASFEEGTFTW